MMVAPQELRLSRDPLEQPARPEVVTRLGLEGRVLERALELASEGPDPQAWRLLLQRLLLFAGALLVLSGIVCFFAFNWQGLHRFGKFALVAAGVAGCALGAWRLGFTRTSAKVLLLAASVLVGVWLAIYGQAYQTGADSFELFRGWALLVLPWVLLARFQALWAFWLLLLNLWLGLWWDQAGPSTRTWLPAAFAGLNGLAWLAWELSATQLTWLGGRWLPRALGLATLAILTFPALAWLAEQRRHDREPWTVPAAILLAGAMLLLFRKLRRDLFMITLALAALIALLTTWLGHLLLHSAHSRDGCVSLLLLGLLLVAQVGAAAAWLRRLGKEGGA